MTQCVQHYTAKAGARRETAGLAWGDGRFQGCANSRITVYFARVSVPVLRHSPEKTDQREEAGLPSTVATASTRLARSAMG